MTSYHALERTNPKGQPFVGRCMICGQEGLGITELEGCSNPDGVSDTAALLMALQVEEGARD